MNRPQSPFQPQSSTRRPILRAAMMNVALCLLGIALYVQTNSVVALIGCAAIGAFVFFNAMLKRKKSRAGNITNLNKQAMRGKPSMLKQPSVKPNAAQNTSNVTPFRRPESKRPSKKSNWPFA
jgi:uncharacterized membrane protein (UPF0136 family)